MPALAREEWGVVKQGDEIPSPHQSAGHRLLCVRQVALSCACLRCMQPFAQRAAYASVQTSYVAAGARAQHGPAACND